MLKTDPWLEAFQPKLLFRYLEESATVYADRPALDFLGKKWTYKELAALVDRAAAGLQAMGVRRGVKVGLCLPNTPYYPIFYFAVLKVGGTVVNYNPLYVERELAFQVADSETSIMVTLDLKALYGKVEAVRARGLLSRIIICPMADILPQPKKLLFTLFKGGERVQPPNDDAHIRYHKLMATGARPEPVDVDPETDIAVLQYTGGTTGSPKGAMLTHRNLSANLEMGRWVFPEANPGVERILCIIPFFHVFAMTAEQNLGVAIGAELILLPRFELKQTLQTISTKKPTLFMGVPTIFTAINNAPYRDRYDLSSLRFCLSGGAPLPMEVAERFRELAGCTLVEGYGLTETSPMIACNRFDGSAKPGSVGQVVAGTRIEIRDLEDPTKAVPQGTKGQVFAMGPQVMAGYWNRPEETAAVLQDNWLATGDVGYFDEDGFLFLVDRIKDVILCSGFNVYPRVIEEALYQHEAVAEAVVIGIPDTYRGQAPKAFVTLKEGGAASPAELSGFLRQYLSKIELPREIEIRDELPKTMVGKLSKKELIEEEARRLAGGESAQ